MKAVAVRPPAKTISHRRTNGTRTIPRTGRSGPGTPGAVMCSFLGHHHTCDARSQDGAVGARPPGDLLAVQPLQQRDDVLAAEAGELLQLRHVQLRARRPAAADLVLQRVGPLAVE